MKDIIIGILLLFDTCTCFACIQHLLDIPPYNDRNKNNGKND